MPDRLTALVERLKDEADWTDEVEAMGLMRDAAAHLSAVAEVAREIRVASGTSTWVMRSGTLFDWYRRLTTTPGDTSEERSD